jgi:hypothetical protein
MSRIEDALKKIKREKIDDLTKKEEQKDKALHKAVKIAVNNPIEKIIKDNDNLIIDEQNSIAINRDAVVGIAEIKETLLDELSADLQIKPLPTSINEVISRVNNYLISCRARFSVPTLSGIARYLGLTRQELLDYNYLKEIFSKDIALYIHKRIVPIIEEIVEEKLLTEKSNNNLHFHLKNNFKGWEKDNKDNTIVINIKGDDEVNI